MPRAALVKCTRLSGMKTLDRYILRQLIGITLLGVMSLTMLMLLGQLFKELHTLLVESGAPRALWWISSAKWCRFPSPSRFRGAF